MIKERNKIQELLEVIDMDSTVSEMEWTWRTGEYESNIREEHLGVETATDHWVLSRLFEMAEGSESKSLEWMEQKSRQIILGEMRVNFFFHLLRRR